MLVGIDAGTQSVKAVVTDARLEVRGEAASQLAVEVPRPGWAEQDPRLWLAALGPTIARALETAGVRASDVRGVGVAGQLDGCIATDAAGEPLAPCLIWMDRRAGLPALDLRALRRRTGIVPDPIHMAPKIAWLRRAIGPAFRYHQPVSFLVARLCGEAVIDPALASTTMLYDLAEADFAPDLLAAFDISTDTLPLLAGSCADRAGRLHAAGAALTGLPEGIPVAVGTGDDFSGTFGGGVVAPGTLACTLGTAEVVGALHPTPLIDGLDLLETHAFPCGGFFLENPGWLCGGAISWLQGVLAIPDVAAFHALAASVPPGADDLLFLPAMTGAMSPVWEPRARGAFYGLTPAHTPGHLARAVLEGCAFAMRDVIDRLETMGVAVTTIRLMGGAARSLAGAQLRADVAGHPVEVARGSDPSAVGAAACAAVTAGLAPDLTTVLASIPLQPKTILPDPARTVLYAERHRAYRRLFDALGIMFEAP